MAAQVTGAFVILDRASRPIRRIRDEALKADAAVTKLGHSLDRVGTHQQRNMMSNTASQIRQIAGESHDATQEAQQLGKSVDKIATPQRTRNITTQAGAIAQTGQAAREADKPVSQLTRGVRKLGDESERGHHRLAKFGASVFGLRQALMLGLIPAIGLAAQGLSALGGGLVALLPRLTQLAGLAAPAGVAVVGVGLAAITAKLAFHDLSKAMAGNKKAIAALTPEAKSFMQTLKQYKPVMQELRQSAQKGLFPGLEVAVRRLQKAVPMAKQLLQGMGGRLGALAAEAAGRFTSKGFLRDFQMIGDQGMHVVTQLGRGFINMASGIRHILVAGLPFTHWLADTILKFTKTWEAQQKVKRENGSLARSFSHAQQALTVMGHVVHNVFRLMHGVMHAASGTSNQLWDSIDRVTKRWADWSNSAKGQHDMRKYFHDIREPLRQIVGFVGDLAKGLAHMAGGSGFTQAMRSLRDAIPSLAAGFANLARTLGPAMFQALSQVIQMASTLIGGAGGEGPFMIMLNTLNGVLGAINGLVQHVPALGAVFAGAFTILALRRFADTVTDLAKRWWLVARGAKAAAVAEGEAVAAGAGAGMGMIGRGGAVGGRARGAAGAAAAEGGALPGYMQRYRSNVSPAVLAAEERRLGPAYMGGFRENMAAGMGASRGVGWMQRRMPGRIGRGMSRAGGFMRALPGLAGGLLGRGGGLIRAGGGALRAGMGAAAEFLAPVAVLSGIAGAIGAHPTRGGGAAVGQRAIAFGDSASFGLAGAARKALGIGNNDWNTSAKQFEQRSYGGVGAGIAKNLRGMGGQDPSLTQAVRQVRYLTALRESYVSDTSKTGRQLYKQLGQQLQISRRMLKQQAETTGSTLAIGFGQAFNIYSRRVGIYKAMDLTTKDVTSKMRSLGPQGSRALAQNMLEWAREQARANPKLWGKVRDLQSQIKNEFDKTHRHIKIVNGQILDGSASQWSAIGQAMLSPVEKAKARMSEHFTAIQREAMSALVLMGYDRGTARNVVAGMEKGSITPRMAQETTGSGQPRLQSDTNLAKSHGMAQGGRLPGLGLSDTVRMAHGGYGAPGELVVNRHTERAVDKDLAMAGRPPLGARVAHENRPHYMATGDRIPMAQGVASAHLNASLRGLHQGVSGLVQRVLAKFPGLSVTSTTGGHHAKSSYHYRGLAADLGGSAPLMNQAAGWIGRTMGASLLEGIHNPNLSVKNGRAVDPSTWGSTVWGQHLGHIHMAAGDGAAIGGLAGTGTGGLSVAARKVHLRRMQAGLGVPSMLLAGGANAEARGMEGVVNAFLAQDGGGATTGGSLDSWLTRALKITRHYSPQNLAGLRTMAMGESGGRPGAIQKVNDVNMRAGNPARGLLQTIPQTFDSYKLPGHGNIMDPVDNAIASIRYQFARYGHIVGHAGYAKGGRVPGFGGWFGTGGTGQYKSPTWIGVGDANVPEHVDVTPIRHHAGQGGANTGSGKHVVINVHPGAVVIHGANAQAGRDAADAFMGRLADLMDNIGMESEVDIT